MRQNYWQTRPRQARRRVYVVIGINAITCLQREDLRALIYVIKNMYVCQSSMSWLLIWRLLYSIDCLSSPARVYLFFFPSSYLLYTPRRDLTTLTTDRAPHVLDTLHLSSWTVIEYDVAELIRFPPQIASPPHRKKLNNSKEQIDLFEIESFLPNYLPNSDTRFSCPAQA